MCLTIAVWRNDFGSFVTTRQSAAADVRQPMFSFFKREKFEPEFPIIDLKSTPDEVFSKLSAVSSVERTEDSDEKDIDYAFVVENDVTRIHVGFVNDRVSYVNYLTEQFNGSEKKKAEKLNWFLAYYGSKEEYGEPNNTGYMIFFHNTKRDLSIVYGLHMGPIRVNNHANV